MKRELGKAATAIYSGIVAGLAALGALLVNDTTVGDITAGQWCYIVLAVLVAGGGVYGLKNGAPPKGVG